MELDVVEVEPTVLEYARFHRLCTDYTRKQPDSNMPVISQDAFDHDFGDPHGAPPLANSMCELTRERLSVSMDAALLLHRSIKVPVEDRPDRLNLLSEERKRILSLKQEIPLLRTDHELDMLHFGNASVPSFRDTKIPLEAVNEERDEGLGWPSKYSAYPAQWYKQAQMEKFEATKESLVHLQETLKDQVSSREVEEMLAAHLKHNMTLAARPVTPPLLPLTPPISPYIPSSPANELPLLSEDSNSTAAEAKHLQNEIMAADSIFLQDPNGHDPMLLEATTIQEQDPAFEASKNHVKRKIDNLKVEGPLTPPIFSDSPAKKLKSVSFSTMIQFIPQLPSTYENGEDILSPHDDFAGFYQDTIPLVEEANRRICNERLVAADTTRRVHVPYLEFSLPLTPWDEYKRPSGDNGTDLDAQMKFMLHVKRFSMKSAETWHGIAKLEKELRWDPAPAYMYKVTVDEKLHGEEDISRLLQDAEPNEIVTCTSSLWYRDRLRILDNDEEEEELEYRENQDDWIDETADLSALARKRKLELEELEHDAKSGGKVQKQRSINRHGHSYSEKIAYENANFGYGTAVRGRSRGTHSPLRHTYKSQAKTRPNLQSICQEKRAGLMFGGKFSASNSLENFLAVQGMSIAPSKINKETNGNNTTTISAQSKTQNFQPCSTFQDAVPSREHQPQERRPPAPLPTLPDHLPPCSFIISSTLLQNRHLSKQIEQLFPAAEFVSRDFDFPHSAAPEADLLLSPSTGLILTTLQLVKQRALPGQPDHSPLKTRIAALQHRYERLLVMITEGLTRDMESYGSTRPPDPRDQEAIQAVEAFAARTEAEVLVRYVPGGETALAHSIVVEMVAYGLPHGSTDIGDIKPLPDETNWERFLRRAGLNPFAAQAVLAWLKDPLEYPLASSSSGASSGGQVPSVRTFGLQTFLMMGVEQRVQSFQAVLGGSRVLRRVSAVLDGEWVSAVHGFRM